MQEKGKSLEDLIAERDKKLRIIQNIEFADHMNDRDFDVVRGLRADVRELNKLIEEAENGIQSKEN